MEVEERAGRNEPEVILDVDFDAGVFLLAVANVGDVVAYGVSVTFDEPLHGLGGDVEVSALPLFRRIELLAPRKRIATLLDSSAAWFARGAPTRIGATVRYEDRGGHTFERRVRHDLRIYRDIAYVVPSTRSTRSTIAANDDDTLTSGSVRHGRLQG